MQLSFISNYSYKAIFLSKISIFQMSKIEYIRPIEAYFAWELSCGVRSKKMGLHGENSVSLISMPDYYLENFENYAFLSNEHSVIVGIPK